MHSFSRKAQFLIWGLVVAFFALYIASVALGGATNQNTALGALAQKPNAQATPDYVQLDLKVNSLDPSAGVIDATVMPTLAGAYGSDIGNGSYAEAPLKFNFDAYSQQTTWDIAAGDYLGGMNLKVRVSGDPRLYPFDTYKGTLFSLVTNSETDSSQPVTLYMRDSKTPVQGWIVSSQQLSTTGETATKDNVAQDQEAGVGLVQWDAQRSLSSIVVAVLFGLLMLVGAVVSVLMTIAILKGKRPPSVDFLAWLAAFLFALFSVRAHMPGDPPSGVLFDLIIFYPVVLVLIALVAITVLAWVLRDDWDLENHHPVPRPNTSVGGPTARAHRVSSADPSDVS